MSETQAQSYTPAPKVTRRGLPVWVWAVVLLVAVAALVGAIVWAGGPNEVAKLLGLDGLSLPSLSLPFLGGTGGGTASQQQAPSAPAASAAPQTAPIPPEAQERMFAEQAESRTALQDLIDGKIDYLAFGTPTKDEGSATVPVRAVYVNGAAISGALAFERSANAWFFMRLSRSKDNPSADVFSPQSFDSGVVQTITEQQALPSTQELISRGLLGRGYAKATVGHVAHGVRTATVDFTLSGGNEPPADGRLVCVSKTDAGVTYWFVARFEKR